ncbi:hypothetical protein FSP39_007399 [Pinctada imbricata]|uniref:Uncharacterized protein n=1 Tax=Pinctada imbricata TaxID=66713 RepID=A0AA89BQ54_PINIB|nr:hypothetical protein FSP39_007399 [Pinctada imbricata]
MVFPFRVQLFYFALKLFLTFIFFFVALEPLFYFSADDTFERLPISGMISFFFLLFSPALVEYIFNSSAESKVMSNKNEIRILVDKWKCMQKHRPQSINHFCFCCRNIDGTYGGGIFTCIIELIFGCCFKFTEDKFCQICNFSLPEAENEGNAPNEGMDIPRNVIDCRSQTHHVSIKFPTIAPDETIDTVSDNRANGSTREESV